jgi:hypothetical protein
MTVVTALLMVLAVLGGAPTALLLVECLLGARSVRAARSSQATDAPWAASRPRIAVVVPAHNESSIIVATVHHLRDQLGTDDILLVVADNCADNTAELARSAGATVIERNDAQHRGKGYALSFATEYLKTSGAPDVVVIVDADCRVSDGGVARLAVQAALLGRPLQADYTLLVAPDARPSARMSAFAFRVRNRVRPRGLQRLGGSVHLGGTGMAFPWNVFVAAPSMRGHITEDLALGVELTLGGHGPALCSDVQVTSDVAPSQAGQAGQRQRWESGHLQTLAHFVPRLIARALVKVRPRLLLTACDLGIPPLALHVSLVGAGAVVSALAAALGASSWPLRLFGAELVATAASVLVAWLAVGRDVMRASDWMTLPGYVFAKIPLYLRLVGRKGATDWNKTERKT